MIALPNTTHFHALAPAVRVAAILMMTGLIATGCGRKGNLDIPNSQPVVQDSDEDKEPPKKDRRFILDGLLE